jgi:hypothetical protein
MVFFNYSIMTNQKKESENRCAECNITFETKENLEKHKENHSVVCTVCPIDMAIQGISKLFRRNKHSA